MYRSGNHLQVMSTLLLLSIWLGFTTPARANIRFYTVVQQNCSAFKISTDATKMNLEEESDGSLTFTLQLESRRNNLQEVIIFGYVATGRAVERTRLNVKTIHIIVTIPTFDNAVSLTTADISLVEQLVQREITSEDFMPQLQWN